MTMLNLRPEPETERETGGGTAGTETETRALAAPETETGADGTGKRLTLGERAGAVLRHWGEEIAAAEAWGGGRLGLLGQLRKPEPEGLRVHWQHIRSIRWLPEGYGGWWKLIPFFGVVGHCLLTLPAKGAAKALRYAGSLLAHAADRLDWATDRAPRFLVVILLTTAIVLLAWSFLA